MKASDITASEYNPYYETYIKLSGDAELIESLKSSHKLWLDFFNNIPEEKLEFRYEEGKWTIKEIILHLIDTERVFAYRAMRFSRQDKTPLQGFDQDVFVAHSNANSRSLSSLLSEYTSTRHATLSILENLTDVMLKYIGEASGSGMSARAAGFIIVGHEAHHCKVIKARYL